MIDIISETVEILREGGVILYPTDTIWGLGCDATITTAIDKINKIKNREPDKKYILLVDSIESLKKYVPRLHPRIETLHSLHMKPLTLIYQDTINLPEHLMSEDGSVAIRITLDPFCQHMIKALGNPVISTSANVNGCSYPNSFMEIDLEIKDQVDHIVNLKKEQQSTAKPSVIARVDAKGGLHFIRD